MTINDVVSFWDAQPCNAKHSISDDPLEYSRQVTARKYRVEPHIPGFAQFERWKDKFVLDLGCGIGTMSISFGQAGAKIYGVDISDESLKIARMRRSAEKWLPGTKSPLLSTANIENLRMSDFDLVFSFGVIHHTPHPELAIKSAYGALKPGGEFRLMVYNRYSWKALWIVLKYGKGRFWKWKELIPKWSEAQTGCPITWTYTPSSVRNLLEECGFIVESISKDHIFPYRIQDYIQYRYVKEWYWRLLPERVFNWLERRIGWHLLVVAVKPSD